MPDIRERFRVFDWIEPPDLWPEAEHRAPIQEGAPGPGPIRRLAIGLLAFAVAAAGFALAVRAIGRRSGQEPATTSTNGSIAFVHTDDPGNGPWRIELMSPGGAAITVLTPAS